MLCFSELGTRRVRSEEDNTERDRGQLPGGWSINYIRPAVFESSTRAEGPRAWLSSISKK